jgi:hypothetical protein
MQVRAPGGCFTIGNAGEYLKQFCALQHLAALSGRA